MKTVWTTVILTLALCLAAVGQSKPSTTIGDNSDKWVGFTPMSDYSQFLASLGPTSLQFGEITLKQSPDEADAILVIESFRIIAVIHSDGTVTGNKAKALAAIAKATWGAMYQKSPQLILTGGSGAFGNQMSFTHNYGFTGPQNWDSGENCYTFEGGILTKKTASPCPKAK